MAWLSSDAGVARRRRLLLGVVAAAAVLLVVVPSCVASRPAFVARYPGLSAYHKTWARSVHAKVPCQDCHVPPRPLPQALQRARWAGEFYLSLLPLSREPAFAPPTNEACANCHVDLRTVSTSGDLNIPHRAHVEILNMRCVRCHKFLVHQPNPEGTNKPRMVACLTCHDGKTAKNTCSACHREKAAPVSHRASDWVIVHAGKQGEVDCAACHGWTKRWCADCHSRRPRSHGVDWRSTHGSRVASRRNCEVCHESRFCIRCHGELPAQNLDPALRIVR